MAVDGPDGPSDASRGELGGIDQKAGLGALSGPPDEGSESSKPKRRRGKTISVEAVRSVNYYRFTTHELDLVAEPQRDGARAQALSAFALGLFVTTIGNFSFGKPDSDVVKGMWIAVSVVSFAAAVFYFFEARRLRKLGTTRLQAIKDEHDFT